MVVSKNTKINTTNNHTHTHTAECRYTFKIVHMTNESHCTANSYCLCMSVAHVHCQL